jgi:hypothetical protein
MHLEIATPDDFVVEVRVDGPTDRDGGSLIAWTLAAVPATSAVLLDLTRLDRLDDALVDSIDAAIRDLERRRVPIVVLSGAADPARSWVDAGAVVLLADRDAARRCAASLMTG